MMKFFKNNKYIILACVILLAGSYGGYRYYQSTRQTESTVRLGQVTKGNLAETVSATGALAALDNVDISSKITGRIVDVLVKENQHVNAGDVLVRLDDTALRATLKQMEAKLVDAQLTYNRDLELLNRGAISQAAFDAAYADYLVAKSVYDKAVSDVNDTVITTPISGYIIGKPTPVGQTISSGISTPQVIMSVATLDNMEIETLVDESDIGRIKEGQKVNFTVDAFPDETFTGVVRLLSKKAITENNVIYYNVYVTVDDAKGKLLPTMTARAEFIVDEADDVTMVPLNCIYSQGKRRYVKVYNEKTKESRDVDVTLGLSNDNDVVVTGADLQPGEKLLVKKAVAKQTSTRMGPPMH
ncbi:efflux RND transporter periplasmic adaptor subunit [uncultured Phascolarctobacterium sp.]|uniref:efflux RND transporter periplasmic adaptor subunit n=1 Tax=uncultured Phascolarctobacterium sp. TaxID=512296 RepID=UPI00262D2EBF|nr:efflux RND transporter periplasmic adaptor subunit [uncultured Phascolarctobacterium sp.]